MKAAVVHTFDHAPRYDEYPAPINPHDHDQVIDVLAAGLHPRVRSQADGSHYTSTGVLPLVPGVDGVGRGADGLLRYFVLEDTTLGSMAEQTVIDPRRSVVLPEGTDPVAVAAGMNPVMSSWLALRRRIRFDAGQSVLILGATGSAGRMAVQVAAMLGASRVVAAGRNAARLSELAGLGAQEVVSLAGEPEEVARTIGAAASGVDVVLDYVWGEPTSAALTGVITHRADRGAPLTWVQIGSVAGSTAAIPSAALRAAALSIVGSGQGSVSTRDILAELPGIAEAIISGRLEIDARAVPLADVEQAWSDAPRTEHRIVIVP